MKTSSSWTCAKPRITKEATCPGRSMCPQASGKLPEFLCEDALNIVCGYSERCQLAARAGRTFAGKGYRVIEMAGGFEAWKSNNFEIAAL